MSGRSTSNSQIRMPTCPRMVMVSTVAAPAFPFNGAACRITNPFRLQMRAPSLDHPAERCAAMACAGWIARLVFTRPTHRRVHIPLRVERHVGTSNRQVRAPTVHNTAVIMPGWVSAQQEQSWFTRLLPSVHPVKAHGWRNLASHCPKRATSRHANSSTQPNWFVQIAGRRCRPWSVVCCTRPGHADGCVHSPRLWMVIDALLLRVAGSLKAHSP